MSHHFFIISTDEKIGYTISNYINPKRLIRYPLDDIETSLIMMKIFLLIIPKSSKISHAA